MPLDAICLAAVREELSTLIEGTRIDKVQQPERDIIILALRGAGVTRRLLISSGSGDARVHLTDHQFENPASPPMFCMLLRKHLIGARIIAITQPPAERAMRLSLMAPDALGVLSEKNLIIELVGRLSNVILTGSDGIIIDCLRRIGGELSDKRMLLPGLLYRPLRMQEGKIDPLSATGADWQAAYERIKEKTADNWLLSAFSALSPLICREIAWRAYGETDISMNAIKDGGEALRIEFFGLVETVKAGGFEPWSITGEDNSQGDFSYTRIMQYEGAFDVKREESFSAMLDDLRTRYSQIERTRRRASATAKTVKVARDRLRRKLAVQREELKRAGERGALRECGDIIMANLHFMEKGQSELVTLDLYSEDEKMRNIRLDPLKTPQQNAAKYYKSYTKAKNAEIYLAEQILFGESELNYLESVIGEIALAEGESDLQSIRDELLETGYLRAKKQAGKKASESAPTRFDSSTGLQIFAGRNNTQNDRLTLKTASRTDVWMHAQKAHGAHVIIYCEGKAPDEKSIYEVAVIAAYFSSARAAGKVPVDYTLIKNVKKPPGGRPGMVIYSDFKTIIVPPDEELINRLRSNPNR